MTVAAITPTVTYLGNGSAAFLVVPFRFLAPDDVVVTRIAASGATTVLARGVDYSVVGAGASAGSVIPSAPIAAGVRWRITRATQRSQPADYVNGDSFSAETHELALDRQMLILQEVGAQVSDVEARALRVPVGDVGLVLPPKALRAGGLLGFDLLGSTMLYSPDLFRGPEGQRGPQGSGNIIGIALDDYCTINTPAGNSAGLRALAAMVNLRGGGVTIDLTPGKQYLVGEQTFGPAITDTTNRFWKYTGVPGQLAEFVNCTKPITIRGNGARFKLIPGKYGAFDGAGAPMATTAPYYGNGISAYYLSVLLFESCSGFITIENLEIDGSSNQATLGGPWGDVGYQLGGCGIQIRNCSGGGWVNGVNCHHHTSDGIQFAGFASAAVESSVAQRIYVTNSTFNYNGRLGGSVTGGRDYAFLKCHFKYNANSALSGSPVSSAPASGFDVEPDAGRPVRDVYFEKCEFEGNFYSNFITASGDTKRVTMRDCKFVSSVPGSIAVVPNKPGFRMIDCVVAGTVNVPYVDVAKPQDCFSAEGCTFTNADEYSPTGTTYSSNRLLFDGAARGVTLRHCTLEFAKAGYSAGNSTDEVRCIDCTIIARPDPAGGAAVAVAFYGRFSGTSTEFIESGTAYIDAIPGGGAAPFGGKGFTGHAEDAYFYTRPADGRVQLPATFSRTEGKAVYRASIAFNPPSLAIGGKSAIQTMPLAGVTLPGAKVTSVSFSADLAGLRIVAWVSAANTVSYYAINENGTDPLDLAAGTLTITALGA